MNCSLFYSVLCNRVDVHRKENIGSVEKSITIYGNPENCTQACKKILEVMQQEAANTTKTPWALFYDFVLIFLYYLVMVSPDLNFVGLCVYSVPGFYILNFQSREFLFSRSVLRNFSNLSNEIEGGIFNHFSIEKKKKKTTKDLVSKIAVF